MSNLPYSLKPVTFLRVENVPASKGLAGFKRFLEFAFLTLP